MSSSTYTSAARTKITASTVLHLSNIADERVTTVREGRYTTVVCGRFSADSPRYVKEWKMGGEHDPGNLCSIQIRQAIREGKNTINLITPHVHSLKKVEDLVREMYKMGIIE